MRNRKLSNLVVGLAGSFLILSGSPATSVASDDTGYCDRTGPVSCDDPVPSYRPPPVDPRIIAANELVSQAVAAWNAGNFKDAASLYGQAYALDPRPEYKKDQRDAMHYYNVERASYFLQRGFELMDEHRYAAALKQFNQAQSFAPDNDDILNDILNAKCKLRVEEAAIDLRHHRYDEAITGFNNSGRCLGSAELVNQVNWALHDKAVDLANQALKAGNYSQAELKFREAYGLKHTEDAEFGVPYAALMQALKIAERGDFTDIMATFDRAMQVAREFGAGALGANQTFLHNLDVLYQRAGQALASGARTPAQREEAIKTMERWSRESGGNAEAKKSLANLFANKGTEAAKTAKNAQEYAGAAKDLGAAAQQDPTNRQIRAARDAAAHDATAAAKTESYIGDVIGRTSPFPAAPAGKRTDVAVVAGSTGTRTPTPAEQALGTAKKGAEICMDGAKGTCVNSADNAPTFDLAKAKAGAIAETPEMKSLKAEVDRLQKITAEAEAKLSQTTNPFDHANAKSDYNKAEYDWHLKLAEYNDMVEKLTALNEARAKRK